MGHHRLATPDLARIFGGESVVGFSEWQLLERYLECRDEVAFEALVVRHGPMVLGVCRRMLANPTDVEDAFQATFLVLVRRARHLGPRDAVGPWLYGVATRVAMRARSEAARRCQNQALSSDLEPVIHDRSAADREIAEVIDQELNRLPPKYRDPIVLCYLGGLTHEEAARQLKWPIGTVKGRLARARDLLRSRLVRRGLTPAVGTLSVALSPNSSAALQRELVDRTVKASLKLTLGQSTAQIVSTSIASLVEGVLTSMFLNSLKWTGTAVLAGGLAFTSIGVMARQAALARREEAPPARNTAAVSAQPEIRPAIEPTANGKAPAITGRSEDREHKIESRDRTMKEGQGKDAKSQMIFAKLDEPISMSFAEDTTLEHVLKYVKQATTTKTYQGISIYVDPIGLQQAEKSMTSTVRNMDLEGVPLRRTLQLLLKQLELIYFVDDGVLCITSAESEGRFDPAIHEPSPIMQKAEKAERGELSLTEMKELIEILKTRDEVRKLVAGVEAHDPHVAQSKKEGEETKHHRETMEQLLKQVRELLQKAHEQTKNAAEGK